MDVTRSVLLPQPADFLFALVEHAEHYPEFLPWCTKATILERRDDFVCARVGFGFRGLQSHMVSEVIKRPFERMDVQVSGWPFDGFRARWCFEPLGDRGCRVTFSAQTGFHDSWWASIMQLAAGFIADRLVAAFVARARQLASARPSEQPGAMPRPASLPHQATDVEPQTRAAPTEPKSESS